MSPNSGGSPAHPLPILSTLARLAGLSTPRHTDDMHNEFTAIIERDDRWFIAYCPEVPGANGQGATKDEARASLAAAIRLILEDRREDALRGLPDDALQETVSVG